LNRGNEQSGLVVGILTDERNELKVEEFYTEGRDREESNSARRSSFAGRGVKSCSPPTCVGIWASFKGFLARRRGQIPDIMLWFYGMDHDQSVRRILC
jgi:hypothetical protein